MLPRATRRALMVVCALLLLPTVHTAQAQSLFPSIERDDLTVLKRLLANNRALLRDTTFGGNTPLHYAVTRHEQQAIIDALLENGADPNIRNSSGYSVMYQLFVAADPTALDSLALVTARKLSEHGADPDIPDATGASLLVRFVKRRNAQAVRTLIDLRANVNIVTQGWTPLDVAMAQNDTTTARLLESHGAIATGRSELFSALARSDTAAVARLLKQNRSLLGSTNVDGGTPLHVAAMSRDTSMAALLIAYGARVNAWDLQRRTPLHWAMLSGSEPAVTLLAARGADTEARDLMGLSPLALNPHGEQARGLSSATSGARGRRERTDIDAHRYLLAVQGLIARGADIDAIDWHHRTPLHWAAADGLPGKARILLDSGANVNHKNSDSLTPLHYALGWTNPTPDHIAVAELLLDRGAHVDEVDLHGVTPLLYLLYGSQERSETDVLAAVRLLVSRNADVNARDDRGATPLALARKHAYPSVVSFLLSRKATD